MAIKIYHGWCSEQELQTGYPPKGEEYIIFRTIDIAYFYLENKTCFLVDIRNGSEHKVSGSLQGYLSKCLTLVSFIGSIKIIS